MEFGENGAVISNAHSTIPRLPAMGAPREPGLFGRPNLYIRRNKLACIVTAWTAMLLVSLSALCMAWMMSLFSFIRNGTFSLRLGYSEGYDLSYTGLTLALSLCLYNFVLFPIIVPVTWAAISQTAGRLVHRGITAHRKYIRTMMVGGAFLVGSVCLAFALVDWFAGTGSNRGYAFAPMLSLVGTATFTGAVAGALAGFINGIVFLIILRPRHQLAGVAEQTAAAF